MKSNYYAVLEVSPKASATEIKRAYHRLARLYHPDVNSQAQDEKIKRLNEAYAVLGDTKKRAAYDAQIRQARLHAQTIRGQPREPRMTWMEGVVGFVRELKKEMRD